MQYDFKMYVNGKVKYFCRLHCQDNAHASTLGHGMMYAMHAIYKRPMLEIYCNGELSQRIS